MSIPHGSQIAFTAPVRIPWDVRPEHRFDQAFSLFRAEMRRRTGIHLGGPLNTMIDEWIAGMNVAGTVLDYDQDHGWRYVPRRQGIDLDLHREPDAPRA